MIVIDTYIRGYFIPIWYERKHSGPYILQQLKSAMQLEKVHNVEIDFDSTFELEIPKGVRVHKDLKRFFKVIKGNGYRLISIRGITLQIKDTYEVPDDNSIGRKEIISLPRNIEKRLITLLENCSVISQKHRI